ncbi:MAG: hypothetical protein HYS27_17230 [Deltaproteobacteria bacterium]|nr:hypothetical protein [Deltaproteobacteria bacterium]
MNDQLQQQLHNRIQAFATDITSLLQGAVADAVASALKVTPTGSPGRRGARPVAALRAGPSIDANALLREVARKPGRGVEEIASSLRMNSKRLRPVMAKLLKAGKVKRSGKARGSKYRAA